MLKMGNRWNNKDGKISIRTLFWVILIAAAVHIGIKFAPPYITYFMIKTEVENDAGNMHLYTDEQIVKYIMIRVKEFELPIEEKDIIIERRDSDIEVSLNYKIDVNFFNGYTKTLYFKINVVKPIKAK